ncbi:MAG: integral rane sensor signal transduction histidine kinase [Firmicutes bacterium]|nr:integral rane sensor signal transduction histidine kinase [Bacillota bacterium]
MRHSLQLKLLFSFMLVITILIGSVLFGVSILVKEQTLAAKQQELIAKGTDLAGTLQSFHAETGDFADLDLLLANAASYLDSRIWVLDASRRVVNMSGMGMGKGMGRGPGWRMNSGSSPGNFGQMGVGLQSQGGMNTIINELDSVFIDGKTWTKTFNNPYYGEKMLVVAIPITLANGKIGGAVLLHAPVADIDAFMQHIYYYIGGAGILAILIALLIVSRLTRDVVRPLKAMQQTAETMALGDYSALIKVETSDEVGRLGLALNSLARDLAQYIAQLENAEKLRRDFVANVSHELRTPLTIIRGYTEALLDGTVDSPDQTLKYHRQMRDESERLERLIKELLDLSRLQSGRTEPAQDPIPLTAIANSVVNMMNQQAQQKQITLTANTSQHVPDIHGNGDRLTQLVFILLDNAIKYTPSGGTVTVNILQDIKVVILKVTDTGIGIPAEDLPYIWERFYKVDKSHCRADDGTGLGLAIAKQIIDLHQAEAVITSELRLGTTFTIRFPLDTNRDT